MRAAPPVVQQTAPVFGDEALIAVLRRIAALQPKDWLAAILARVHDPRILTHLDLQRINQPLYAAIQGYRPLYAANLQCINHVAAYILTDKGNIILQNFGAVWQALGGYNSPHSLPYMINAMRLEMLDEGNVVVTNDNLIRASPLYVRPLSRTNALLQVFLLKEGPWTTAIRSQERARFKKNPNVVHLVPLAGAEATAEKEPHTWSKPNVDSFNWLKAQGVFAAIQDAAGAEELWKNGPVQTFSATHMVPSFFPELHAAVSGVQANVHRLARSAWAPLALDDQDKFLVK